MKILKPKVTIGVCVRNCESTILKTVESIVNQDYPHELLEVLVVDGYSSDKTVQIIKEVLSNSDIENHIFFENRGLGFARQIIVDNAQGKYIVWVDGDMILPKDFVRKQVEFMELHKKVGIGKGRYALYDTNTLVAYLENISAVVGFKNSRSERTYRPLGTSGSIYRVEAIKRVGGFNEAIKGAGEDTDAELRVIKAGWKLSLTPAFFYERRRECWKDLWCEYFWHGYGGSQVKDGIKESRSVLYMFFPPIAALTIISQAIVAYKTVKEKKVFLLPFHWIFKRIAWFLGFLKGILDNLKTISRSRNHSI